jgi:hypothetical protein
MSKLEEGFTADIKNQDYHDDRDYVSSSGLKLMLHNPKLYYDQYVLGKEDTSDKPQAAFDFGSYIHTRVLEPEKLEEEYAIYEGATKRGKKWDEFKENNPDKILLSLSQVKMADQMMEAYENDGVEIGRHGFDTKVAFSSFFKNGDAELTACTSLLDIPVKVRFDYYKNKNGYASINDVKTTAEGVLSLENIQNICDRYHYDLSAALYTDVATALTGEKHDFYFLFMSKKPPFDVRLFRASEEMLQRGRDKYQQALVNLGEARQTGVYYESKIEEIK